MDDERLKNGGSVLTREYFEHLLERIREKYRIAQDKLFQSDFDWFLELTEGTDKLK